MPITLNHSNIGVQYSTGSNYIIETVKSDLYRKNEIIDTIVRDNIQVAPVTPTTYVDSGNVYAVESYTYYGSANTADFTRVFTKNTTCDILVIGGGGGGGKRAGGGGGAGTLLYHKNVIFNGTYNIKVGKGGAGHPSSISTTTSTAFDGEFSQFVKTDGTQNYYAVGGGRGMGSLAPNIYARTNGGQGFLYDSNLTLSPNNIFNGVPVTVSNKEYVNTLPLPQGCRGNIGGLQINNYKSGGGGGAGGVGMNHAEETTINDGYGGLGLAIDITGTSVVYAGGGNGTDWNGTLSQVFDPLYPTIQLRGGGGFGSDTGTPQNGLDGTGGGGGAQGNDTAGNPSGAGGSGIVIIRYLLGTIPITNYLTNEPVVSPYVIVADGYYPRTPATNSATWTDNGYTVTVKVSDATLYGVIYYICNNKLIDTDEWHSTNVYTINNNTTYSGSTNFKGNAGIAFGIDLGRPIYPKRIRIAPRANHPSYGPQLTSAPGTFKIYASNNPSSWNDNNHIDWILIHSQISPPTFVNLQFTIITLSNIPSISYRYYTMVIMTTAGSYGYLTLTEWNIGGDEKIDAIPEGNPITHKRLNFAYNSDNLVAWYKFNGDYLDSSGNGHNLTNVGTVIQSTQVIEGQAVEFDSTDYLEFPSTINPYTIWNGKGITFSFWVRFTAHELWSRIFELQPSLSSESGIRFSVKSAPATGASAINLRIGSTEFNYSNWSNSLITNLNVWRHFVLCVDVAGKWDLYLDNVRINGTETSNIPNITYNIRYINKSAYSGDGSFDAQMDDFRIYDRAFSAADVASLYNKTYVPNLYTLNFQVPTLADINNNSNIVLRGAYDIALSTSNALIIPKSNQYIPKPTTFTNYAIERMYPPVRNFTAATTAVSGQTYGNGTYVVTYSSTYGENIDPFKCFNTSDGTGGAWAVNRYSGGVFNSSSFIVAGYLGDWLKIQLPVAIKLTRFSIKQRNGNENSPKDFKIYGSNDNITWVELVNKTDAIYNASYYYEQITPEITNTYTYYALVVNKLVSTSNILNFDEWYIYGQELLPSSLSLRYHLLNPTLDPIGAQWTYSSNNTNVYHMGRVGIGTTNPEYQLDVRGFIFTSAGGYTQTGSENWVVQSDRRIKENIVKASYEKCLDNVKKIELYNFNFKDNCVNTNDKNQLGFIAQEVQQVYPKAVEVGRMILDNNQGINDLLTLNTTQIKYTLYGAVKNLIERVENIESRVEQIYNMTLSSNIKSSSSNISITFITPLTPNITTNTSNITTNTSNITTNTSNVSRTSNITTNSSNITANTSNITTNTSNVSTNSSNVSTNTSNTTTNTSNITTNTSNITTNSSNITTNTSNTTTNTSNI
jgi:hypothetical protein